jgi:flagellar biogenesis protein FliO
MQIPSYISLRNLQMDKLINLFELITAINDPATQMFIAMLMVLGVIGLALYVVVLALKRGAKP